MVSIVRKAETVVPSCQLQRAIACYLCGKRLGDVTVTVRLNLLEEYVKRMLSKTETGVEIDLTKDELAEELGNVFKNTPADFTIIMGNVTTKFNGDLVTIGAELVLKKGPLPVEA